jgi:hypothetical protein
MFLKQNENNNNNNKKNKKYGKFHGSIHPMHAKHSPGKAISKMPFIHQLLSVFQNLRYMYVLPTVGGINCEIS